MFPGQMFYSRLGNGKSPIGIMNDPALVPPRQFRRFSPLLPEDVEVHRKGKPEKSSRMVGAYQEWGIGIMGIDPPDPVLSGQPHNAEKNLGNTNCGRPAMPHEG